MRARYYFSSTLMFRLKAAVNVSPDINTAVHQDSRVPSKTPICSSLQTSDFKDVQIGAITQTPPTPPVERLENP